MFGLVEVARLQKVQTGSKQEKSMYEDLFIAVSFALKTNQTSGKKYVEKG